MLMLVSPEDPIQSLPKLRYRSSKTAGILRGGYRMSDFKVCLFLCVFFFVRSGAALAQWTVHSSDGPWAEFVHNHMVKGQPSLLKFKVKGAFFTSWGIWAYGAIPVVLDQLLFHECCGHYHTSHIYFLDNFRLDQPEFPGKWKKSQTL